MPRMSTSLKFYEFLKNNGPLLEEDEKDRFPYKNDYYKTLVRNGRKIGKIKYNGGGRGLPARRRGNGCMLSFQIYFLEEDEERAKDIVRDKCERAQQRRKKEVEITDLRETQKIKKA